MDNPPPETRGQRNEIVRAPTGIITTRPQDPRGNSQEESDALDSDAAPISEYYTLRTLHIAAALSALPYGLSGTDLVSKVSGFTIAMGQSKLRKRKVVTIRK